jgi:hypothetical protein
MSDDVTADVLDTCDAYDPTFASAPTNYSIEDSGACYLARLILEQAACDAVIPYDTEVRRAARWYLTNDTVDLRFICGIARVNHKYVMETWTKRLGTREPLPEKKRMFDFLKKEKRHVRRGELCGCLTAAQVGIQT